MNQIIEIASRLLAAFASGGGSEFYAMKGEKEKWAALSLEWADELIKQGEKNDRS